MAASMVPPVWACYQVRDEMTRTATCRIYSSQGRSLNTAEVRLRVRSIPRAGLERRTRSSSGEERFADGREILRRLLRLDGEQRRHEQHGVGELPHRLELPPDLVGGPGHHEGARHVVGDEVGDAAIVAALDTLLELSCLGAEAVGGEVALVLLDPTVEGHAGAGVVQGFLDVRVRCHPEPGADVHVRALLAGTCKSGLEVHVCTWYWVTPNTDVKESLNDARACVAFYGGVEQYESYFAAHGFGAEARQLQEGVKRGDYRSVAHLVPDD